MSENLAELSARISAAGWQPRDGMLCRDPETGSEWRRLDSYRWEQTGGERLETFRDGKIVNSNVLGRAIKAGPDLTDEMTVMGLLSDLDLQSFSFPKSVVWQIYVHGVNGPISDMSKPACVAKAWLASNSATARSV